MPSVVHKCSQLSYIFLDVSVQGCTLAIYVSTSPCSLKGSYVRATCFCSLLTLKSNLAIDYWLWKVILAAWFIKICWQSLFHGHKWEFASQKCPLYSWYLLFSAVWNTSVDIGEAKIYFMPCFVKFSGHFWLISLYFARLEGFTPEKVPVSHEFWAY